MQRLNPAIKDIVKRIQTNGRLGMRMLSKIDRNIEKEGTRDRDKGKGGKKLGEFGKERQHQGASTQIAATQIARPVTQRERREVLDADPSIPTFSKIFHDCIQ